MKAEASGRFELTEQVQVSGGTAKLRKNLFLAGA